MTDKLKSAIEKKDYSPVCYADLPGCSNCHCVTDFSLFDNEGNILCQDCYDKCETKYIVENALV